MIAEGKIQVKKCGWNS